MPAEVLEPVPSGSYPPHGPDPQRVRLWLLLGGMMFLEYAVWGAWMPVLSATLVARGVGGASVGNIYSALYLALIFTPFLGGQIADRWLPSQRLLALTHLLGAGAAFVLANQTTTGGLYLWMLIWALLFAPSLGVTNAIALHHIDRLPLNEAGKEREFSWIRTAGTFGWIVAAFLLLAYSSAIHADPTGKTGPLPEMQLTGLLGIAMAIFSLLLPNTPPSRKNVDPLAFRRAFALFKNVPGFAVFMAISFVAATEFQFFYVLSGPFLNSGIQIPLNLIPIVKSISQVMEVAALALLLPLWLPKKGMRWCLLVGSFAWPLRYLIFAAGKPAWLVVLSLGLHGFGYAFVLVVQQIYVDRVAPKDIRSSAQNLLNVVTLGVGNYLGSIFCGMVLAHYTVNGVTNWPPVFVLPAITTTLCAIAYAFTFRDKDAIAATPVAKDLASPQPL
jgi:nucleoside transporter